MYSPTYIDRNLTSRRPTCAERERHGGRFFLSGRKQGVSKIVEASARSDRPNRLGIHTLKLPSSYVPPGRSSPLGPLSRPGASESQRHGRSEVEL